MPTPENPNTKRHQVYERLLSGDKKFEEWLGAANPSVWGSNFRRLGLVCDSFNVTPKQLARMSPDSAFSFLLKVKISFEKKGKTGAYIHSILKCLKSWYAFNNINITKKISIKIVERRERVPSNSELRAILAEARLRARATCALLAFTGCRPEVLGNYSGSDGLKIGDLTELRNDDGRVFFSKVPTLVSVRPEISKSGHAYVTFLNKLGCEILSEYLQWRSDRGEKLAPESPIITADPQRAAQYGKCVVTQSISALVRQAIRKAGKDFRPYVLRRFFAMRMMEAEAAGLIIRDWRVFWMGHNNIELVYTLNKGELPSQVVEQMRAGYLAADGKYLSPEPAAVALEDVKVETYRGVLTAFTDMTPDEINRLELAKLTPDELKKLTRNRYLTLTQEVMKEIEKTGRAKIVPSGEWVAAVPQTQRIVTKGALPEALRKGERVVLKIDDNQYVVERPKPEPGK